MVVLERRPKGNPVSERDEDKDFTTPQRLEMPHSASSVSSADGSSNPNTRREAQQARVRLLRVPFCDKR